MTTTKAMTLYRITASQEPLDGQIIDASQAEVLGDAYGRTYASKRAAVRAANDLQDSIEDYGLDPTTAYCIVEVELEVSDVSVDQDPEHAGAYEVSAQITIPADATVLSTVWSAQPRHTAAGIDPAVAPAGDGPDCWIDHELSRVLGQDAAIAIGLEIIAGL